MKVCRKCGRPAADELEVCKRCGGELVELPQTPVTEADAQHNEKRKRRDWLFMIIGFPVFIIVIYLLYGLLASLGR